MHQIFLKFSVNVPAMVLCSQPRTFVLNLFFFTLKKIHFTDTLSCSAYFCHFVTFFFFSFVFPKKRSRSTDFSFCLQGPLPITMADFWRMVWEQKSQVVAMVTLDMEGGKVKCHRYWPESTELPLKVCNRYILELLKSTCNEKLGWKEARIWV